MTTGQEIANQASLLGICQGWENKIRKTTAIPVLAKLFFKGSDFCMRKNFPSIPILRKFQQQAARNNLYLDKKIVRHNPRKVAFFGKSTANVFCNGYGVSQIYIRHDSVLNLDAKDNCFIMIYAMDNAVININQHDNANVYVYYYSDNVTVHGNPFKQQRKWL